MTNSRTITLTDINNIEYTIEVCYERDKDDPATGYYPKPTIISIMWNGVDVTEGTIQVDDSNSKEPKWVCLHDLVQTELEIALSEI